MLHPSGHSKDFSTEYTSDWKDKDDSGFTSPDFYKIDDLDKDGFIHPDGSLRFESTIKKHDF